MEKTLLNLIPGACSPEVHLSQYDKGRAIPFKLAEGKSAYSVPDGSEIVVEATKPSGLGFVVPVTFDGDTATMTITETMSNEYGRFPAELSITKNGNKIGTANFVMNIERSPHPEGTIDGDAESLLPELTLLVERIEAAADSVDEDTQIVTDAKAEVLQAKADTLQAKADTLSARDDALQAKADTITAKESAEASAQAAAESAQEAEDTLSEYAKVDGYYEEMTVGSAEQLLSSQFVEDSVPYKFRTSGGSKDIGNREYDEIVGGSIVWNQLYRITSNTSQTEKGVTVTFKTDGTITFNGTSTDYGNSAGVGVKNVQNHIYFIYCTYSDNTHGYFSSQGFGGDYYYRGKIVKSNNSSGTNYYTFSIASANLTFTNFVIRPMVIDLTQMFGSTIADYIYSLETAQSGKGVAFFKSLFPNDYYPYNAGELLSVEGLQSHDTVGFNQFDKDTVKTSAGNYILNDNGEKVADAQSSYYLEPIEVFPDTDYYFNGGVNVNGMQRVYFFDSDDNFISRTTVYNVMGVLKTPSNCHYIRLQYRNSALNVDTWCINLSWSGWRNGEYEPYKKHSYALDSSLTLRGILKLNASNELYFDGDIYSHDGKVQRRYGIVDLGTLNWVYNSENTAFHTLGLTSLIKKGTGIKANIVCLKYPTYNDGDPLTKDKIISSTTVWGQGNIVVKDSSYTDATAFKTAMNGVMLIYELATPTEETAEPFEEVQIVDDFGTEEYISGNIVPVGHNTKYPANLRDKLQHLPNMADSDGAYLIRQTNKQMSLELFRIPKAPTTDGTYTLKATVSGGTPTYTWEAVE